MNDNQIKHLEFIQNIITRMNSNSFQIKTWSISIVSALLAVYASTSNCYLILIGFFPTLIFWFLDTYYLCQDRKFRGLYNDVAGVSKNPKEIKLFEMRPDLYNEGKYSYWNTFFSTTIWKFYFSIIILLLALYVYLEYYKG